MSQFSTIESLIKFLAPAQKVPSRSEVLDMIDETAQKAREKLKQTVSNVGSLSLTMYLWEDFVNQYTYYGNWIVLLKTKSKAYHYNAYFRSKRPLR